MSKLKEQVEEVFREIQKEEKKNLFYPYNENQIKEAQKKAEAKIERRKKRD